MSTSTLSGLEADMLPWRSVAFTVTGSPRVIQKLHFSHQTNGCSKDERNIYTWRKTQMHNSLDMKGKVNNIITKMWVIQYWLVLLYVSFYCWLLLCFRKCRDLLFEHMWLDKGKSKHKRVSLAAQKHGSMLVWNQNDWVFCHHAAERVHVCSRLPGGEGGGSQGNALFPAVSVHSVV